MKNLAMKRTCFRDLHGVGWFAASQFDGFAWSSALEGFATRALK